MKKSFYLQSLLFCCFILFSVAAKATVPVVTGDPVSVTACTGVDTYFVVQATATPAGTFSWQVSTDGSTWSTLADGAIYTKTTDDTMWVKPDVTLSGYLYRAIVTNTDGADTSAPATLTVIFADAGTITGPANICKTATVTFSDGVAGGVWSSSNTAIATVGSSSGDVSGVNFGYVTISYKVTHTCGIATATFPLLVDSIPVAKPITGPTATCVGNFITLSNANVLGTGTWSASNSKVTVSSTGVVTGVSQGFSVVTYDFTNSCGTVSSSSTITVDTLLSGGVISGDTGVCNGSWTHLSETISGGIWISGTSSVATVDGSGNVTGVAQGTATISYLVSNACGASVATFKMTVFSTAKAISGTDSVGIGATRTLSDATTGGMWYSSDTSIAVIDTNTGVATGKDTGITTITYTVTNICGTSSVTLTLHVGPAPSAGQIYGASGFDSTVCVGATVALFDTAKWGTGTWESSADTIATVSSTGVVTGVKPGIDTIYFTFENAFGTSVVMIPIVVRQPPVISVTGPSIVSLGGNYFFKGVPYWDWDPPTAPNIGTWTASNNVMGQIVGVYDSSLLHMTSIASFVVLRAGKDTLTYSLHNACGTSTKSWAVELKADNSIGQVTDLGAILKVYPNPTEGAITVNLLSDVTEQANVVITNVLGAKVKELSITTNKAANVKLDEPAGIYFLSATTANGKYEAKIIVSK